MVNVPKHVILPLFMSIKHGIIMVNVPQKCVFTIVHVHKTWYNHGKCPQT